MHVHSNTYGILYTLCEVLNEVPTLLDPSTFTAGHMIVSKVSLRHLNIEQNLSLKLGTSASDGMNEIYVSIYQIIFPDFHP